MAPSYSLIGAFPKREPLRQTENAAFQGARPRGRRTIRAEFLMAREFRERVRGVIGQAPM